MVPCEIRNLLAAEEQYTRKLGGMARPRLVPGVDLEDLTIIPYNESAEARTLRLLTLSLSRLAIPGTTNRGKHE